MSPRLPPVGNEIRGEPIKARAMPEEGVPDFDEKRQVMAKRYQRRNLLLSFSALILFALIVFASLPSGLSRDLEAWASSATRTAWATVALYVTVAYLSLAALALPLRISARMFDLKFGLSRQSWRSWILDRMKANALGFLFTLLAVEVLYWTIRTFGGLWWLSFWALATGFTILSSYLAPVLLLPLFYRVMKVDDPSIAERLQKLAERAGIRAVGVYNFASSPKTERGMAALAGLGRTRRILLSDHILQRHTAEEVEGILAHELAHHIQRDPLLYLVLSAALSLLGLYLTDLFLRLTMPSFGFTSLSAVSTLPLFVLFAIIFNTAVGPLGRYVSRRREARADLVAAELCQNPRALASALVKLHDQNLSDASPHSLVEALLYTHPSGRRRVDFLLSRLA
jgi:STE24 endopeptidase